MARYTGARLKIVRRFQDPLLGLTQKSGERRPYPPGQHGPSRRAKVSDYRIRLEEKQKLRFNYGVSERQLRRYFKRAIRVKGDTGQLLLQILESRLDNVVFRAGLATTIPAARQLVCHGHVRVNGKKVDVPSYAVRVGEVIGVREKSKKLVIVQTALQNRSLELPSYLSVDPDKMEATFHGLPTREDVPVQVQENLIVEFYSRVA